MDASEEIPNRFHALPEAKRKVLLNAAQRAIRQHPEKAAEAGAFVTNFLHRPQAAICPIFREHRGTVEQFGCGVLLDISGVKFILTVAHVTDETDGASLLIPGKDGLAYVHGYLATLKMPLSGNRADDTYDISYYRLDRDFADSIHPDLTFLEAADCDLYDVTNDGDAYTVVGYPARKSQTIGITAKTEIFTLSGEAILDERYLKTGRKIQHHLLVQFRRKRAMDYKTFTKSTVCLPEGMSGGGVFAWSKQLLNTKTITQPKLVGIATDYDQSSNVFIATRLNCYIRCIQKSNPQLPIAITAPFSHEGKRRV